MIYVLLYVFLRQRAPLVYLCGPINSRTDAECNGWRKEAKLALPRTLDPMRNDYRGRELEPGIAETIVETDKDDIRQSDTLLVYFDVPSVGTCMEILFAWQLGKKIIVIYRYDKPISPWLKYHATTIVPTLRDGIEACR